MSETEHQTQQYGQQQKSDQKKLSSRFYQDFDPTFFGHVFSTLLQLPHPSKKPSNFDISFIGSGTFFQSWKIKASTHFSYVLKTPRANPKQDGFYLNIAAWVKAMKKLSQLHSQDPIPLIPPFSLLWSESTPAESRPALIMPFGELNLIKTSQHWQPLEPKILGVQSQLGQHGLLLRDIQLAQWQGVPFIFDFSDLKI